MIDKILETINLSEWKTKKQIINELKTNGIYVEERTWRSLVESYNYRYMDGVNDKYIIHGSKGYKLTNDKKEIMHSIQDLRNRSLNMLSKYSRTYKALGLQDNLKIDLEKMEII